ncbi:zinc ribbon domain-containing protein [Colwellia sp. MB02u-10]|jgi:hypothetical protein|uniref:zinc ribbon domain-containing protein n=1 Tax=Colwellia sp. MB02u-10 TaxID=2759828 RepID=UPI0015F59723|nr:zinc ribbon domain-containing protein [Colwellia sp. MB02u-10]MBA6342492.1 zinc ribbon domain-containing protein [Colwellia sp. MB02u-10]
MAVINCPKCKKKISDKAKTCEHCQLDLTVLDADKIASLKRVSVVAKSQQLMNHSFIAMLLFCGGFLFLYSQDAQPGTWQYVVSIASAVLGFILYLITRVRLILIKRNRS